MHEAIEACRQGDRLACDTAEFEGLRQGPPPPAAGLHLPLPTQAELATALIPLLLVSLAARLWSRARRGTPGSGAGGARVHVRRLTRLGAEQQAAGPSGCRPAAATTSNPAQPAHQQQAALPPHPAAAGSSGGANGARPPAAAQRSPTARSLLAAADSALSSLLVLPFSLAQHARHLAGRSSGGRGGQGGPAAGGAAPRTPQVPGASPGSQRGGGSTGPRMYGLGIGEAESDDDEWASEGGESELTQACVRRLQQSPEFKAFLKSRGLTTADVGSTARRLRLYRHLRRLDPDAFWRMLLPGRPAFDSRAPSRLLLAWDYLLSTSANLAAAAAAYQLLTGAGAAAGLPSAARDASAAGLVWLVGSQWFQARPTAGRWYGLWYEEERWGHAAPAWRSVAANLAECAYVAGSAGLGLLISLCLRCLHGRRQSVGELLLAVHPVQEVAVPPPFGDDPAAADE